MFKLFRYGNCKNTPLKQTRAGICSKCAKRSDNLYIVNAYYNFPLSITSFASVGLRYHSSKWNLRDTVKKELVFCENCVKKKIIIRYIFAVLVIIFFMVLPIDYFFDSINIIEQPLGENVFLHIVISVVVLWATFIKTENGKEIRTKKILDKMGRRRIFKYMSKKRILVPLGVDAEDAYIWTDYSKQTLEQYINEN